MLVLHTISEDLTGISVKRTQVQVLAERQLEGEHHPQQQSSCAHLLPLSHL